MSANDSKASDLLMSHRFSGERLTNFYWDDWALSGLLMRGGKTLTLGLAGGTGPRRLASFDPAHRQTGVDLDASTFVPGGLEIERVTDDAFAFIERTRRKFDTIWVDLYTHDGLLPGVLAPDFSAELCERLRPRGVLFFHLFRPENRFYRYARGADPFEPLFASLAASLRRRAWVFDHYASQTWVLLDSEPFDLNARLAAESARLREPARRWMGSYMPSILRRPRHDFTTAVAAESLRAAFHAPVAGEALSACGLSSRTGVSDFDAWSEAPEMLVTDGLDATPENRLRWETMAMWLTGVGLTLPSRCLSHLRHVAGRHRDTGAPEFEWRRPLMDTSGRPAGCA